jgi:hypothetical protein
MGWGVYPEGMRKMLNYIQKEFNPRGGIIITGGLLLLCLRCCTSSGTLAGRQAGADAMLCQWCYQHHVRAAAAAVWCFVLVIWFCMDVSAGIIITGAPLCVDHQPASLSNTFFLSHVGQTAKAQFQTLLQHSVMQPACTYMSLCLLLLLLLHLTFNRERLCCC